MAEINFVAKKGQGLGAIADLKGKAVAFTSPGSVTQGVLALSLEDAGIDPKDALKTVLKDDYYGVGFSADGLNAVDKEMRLIDLLPPGQKAPWKEFIDTSLLPKGAPSVDPAEIGGNQ